MSLTNTPRGSLFALFLILAGALLFLDNVGLLRMGDIGAYWPVALIAVGILILDSEKNAVAAIWAAALIVCGVLIILGNLRIFHVNAEVIYPIMLIAFGVMMLVRPAPWRKWYESIRFIQPNAWRNSSRNSGGKPWSSSPWSNLSGNPSGKQGRSYAEFRQRGGSGGFRQRSGAGVFSTNGLHELVLFGTLNKRVETQNFEGGPLGAVFGYIELDLSAAGISSPERKTLIEASAFFGGIEITVPRTWKIVMKTGAFFGGCEDKTVPPRPEPGLIPETLVIRGGAFFGGITVRN